MRSLDTQQPSQIPSSTLSKSTSLLPSWDSLACRGPRWPSPVPWRRTVDAVREAPDVGWTARLRSLPWAVAAALGASSVASTALAAWAGRGTGMVAALLSVGFTVALAAWFLARLGSFTPTRHALGVSTVGLAIGLEGVKNATAFVVPQLVSRESLLYGSLGSALALLLVALVTSWLLLVAAVLAAELSVASPVQGRAMVSNE